MADIKYIKVVFRKGDPLWFSIDKWEAMLKSDQTLIPFTLDSEKTWTGRTLNKAEVIYSEYDKEYSQKMNEPTATFYRRKSTGVVVKMLEGEIPDNLEDYEKLDH